MPKPARSRRLSGLAVLAIACLGLRADAQCGVWSSGFAAPAPPPGSPFAVASFDDGNGARVYMLQQVGASRRVLRWSGATWEVVFERNVANYTFRDLFRGSLGGVERLFATFVSFSGASATEVWSFDGTTWTQFGSLASTVRYVGVLDDGSGEALYAAGSGASFSQGVVARWNGAGWTQIGPVLPASVSTLAVFDTGAGLQLHAGGSDAALGPGSSVVRWNGASWSAVGALPVAVEQLRIFGGRLIAGVGPTPFFGSGLALWNGAGWDEASPYYALTFDMEEIDFGSGPVLAFGGGTDLGFDGLGFFTLPGGVPNVVAPPLNGVTELYQITKHAAASGPELVVRGSFGLIGGLAASNLAIYDGTSWSTLGRGFDASVQMLCVHDLGAGPRLLAGGQFGVSGYGARSSGIHGWDGANWSAIGPTNFGTEYTLASLDLGSGAELYLGGHNLLGNPNRGVVRRSGNSWVAFAPEIGGDVHALAACDLGAGPRLFAGGNFLQVSFGAGQNITQLVGGAWTPLGSGTNGIVAALCTYDEGGGDELFAGGGFTIAGGAATGGIARWNGATWAPLGAGITGGVNCLCVFDGALYAGGTLTNAGGTPVSYLARWNGSAWSNVPGGGANGVVLALHVHDDGRGPALYVGGGFDTIGGITAYNLARFDGVSWEAVDGGIDGPVNALASVDDDGDGDRELFVGGRFQETATVASSCIARLGGCPHYTSFCAGDGQYLDHTTPCPCGNDGAAGRGCASSFVAAGALLSASGSTFADDVVLSVSDTPSTSTALYMQHDASDDRVFHDGVICAGGNLTRLRTRAAVAGASTFPDSSDTVTLSQRGNVAPGSGLTRFYAVWYRNASSTFCPPATANVTNGLRVSW